MVVAIETGGRWSAEACNFVENLAWAKSREVVPVLHRSAFLAWDGGGRACFQFLVVAHSPVP